MVCYSYAPTPGARPLRAALVSGHNKPSVEQVMIIANLIMVEQTIGLNDLDGDGSFWFSHYEKR